MGGQIANNIAMSLHRLGVKIIGTSPENIDNAENRFKFSRMLDQIGIDQPKWKELSDASSSKEFCNKVGYPCLVRPSYVLSGAMMSVIYSDEQMEEYLQNVIISNDYPVVISKFITDAKEIEVDAVADNGILKLWAISEHVEDAGIHSGDSACVLPPYKITSSALEQINIITKQLALKLGVIGLINIQFAYKDDMLYVLEVNPRASRTTPFVSKSTNVPLAKIAAQLSVGQKLKNYNLPRWDSINHVSIKEAVLPFNKFPAESIFLSPEMKSTGEVMGISENFGLSFYKATLSAGIKLPESGLVFISVNNEDKFKIISIARAFKELGFNIVATEGTAKELIKNGMSAETVYKVGEGRPNIVDRIKNNEIDVVINTPLGAQSRYDEEAIGKACIQKSIMAITTLSAADAVLYAIRTKNKIKVKSIQEYHSS